MKVRNEFKAGLFVISALALFSTSIFILGRDRQVFASQSEFSTSFKDVKGLSMGAPIRLGGITIGRVASIDFAENIEDPLVYVKLLINDRYRDRLRPDSKVMLATQGLLGDRFVSLSTGSGAEILPVGSTISSIETTDLGEVGTKLTSVVDEAARGVKSIAQAGETFESILNEVKSGNGLINQLVYSDKDNNDALALVKNLSDITKQIRGGSGILSALINGKNGEETVKDVSNVVNKLSSAADSIQSVTDRLSNGPGLAHSLVYGENKEGVADLIKTLTEASKNLKSASDSLANGSGSLGALLIDPTLYNNLMEITDKAKRSVLLRQAIRLSLDK